MLTDLIQPTHLLFVLAVALLVLGPKRLPEVGRSLGKGLRDFRSAMSGIEEHTTGLFRDDPISEPHASAEPVVTTPATVSSEPEPADYADARPSLRDACSSSSNSSSSCTGIPYSPTIGIVGLSERAVSTAPAWTATNRIPLRW